jgi:uncharacterized protein YecE (DUF72 family)
VAGRIYVGLSGWSYPEWRDGFYKGVPRRRWLAHCAEHFNAVEVNATFYRMMAETTYAKWLAETPENFAFAIKGNRFVTHIDRLRAPEAPLARQRDNVQAMGSRLRVVLWQMPPRLGKDLTRLDRLVTALADWPEVRHALEFRDTSWFDDETAERLAAAKLAVCVSDAGDWPRWDRVTGDLVYVRLHGSPRTYYSRYDKRKLKRWAEHVRGWAAEGREVHVYFDNDAEGHAPYDALKLIAALGNAYQPLSQAEGLP